MKYQKIPIIVDAWQWPSEYNEDEIGAKIQKVDHDDSRSICAVCGHKWQDHASCPTMSGWHSVCPGDYIVKEITEGFYPCRKDIFERTYNCLNEE